MRWLVLQLTLAVGIIGVVAGGWWLYAQDDAISNMHVLGIKTYTWIINTGYLSPEYQAAVFRYRADSYAAIGDRKHAIEDQEMARDLAADDAVLKVTPAAGPETR